MTAPPVPPPGLCRTCGRPVAPHLRFCPNCGTERAVEPVPAAGPTSPPAGGLPRPRWLAPVVVGTMLLAAGVGAAAVWSSRSGEAAQTPTANGGDRSAESPPPDFARAFGGSVDRLSVSVATSGRVLGAADGSEDLGRVVRMARQQQALVATVSARVAARSLPDDVRLERSRSLLLNATRAHEAYLNAVEATADQPVSEAASFPGLRAKATATLDAYRAFFRSAPGVRDGVTAGGLARLAGLKQGVDDAVDEAAEAERRRLAAEAAERRRRELERRRAEFLAAERSAQALGAYTALKVDTKDESGLDHRYTPEYDDKAPGERTEEGGFVGVYCWVVGENSRGRNIWVRIGESPARWAPAHWLQDVNGTPGVPNRVPHCDTT